MHAIAPPFDNAMPTGRLAVPGRRVAAPSWVRPASLAENCRFLAGKVDEVGLLFFDGAASLAYTRDDLPCWMADLPLRYHLHLPVDLRMHGQSGGAGAAEKDAGLCDALFGMTDFLRQGGPPLTGVLHPPALGAGAKEQRESLNRLDAFLRAFVARGQNPARLLLENVRGNDLLPLKECVREYGLGLCLDMGHVLAYGQQRLVRDDDLMERVAMLHVNAPGMPEKPSSHISLARLDAKGRAAARAICRRVPEEAVLMMELFSWEEIEESLPIVRSWLLPQG